MANDNCRLCKVSLTTLTESELEGICTNCAPGHYSGEPRHQFDDGEYDRDAFLKNFENK